MDQFSEYKDFYKPDFDPQKNPVPRPQPIDFVVSFFNGKRNGFFIDIGAFDGVTWSNSLSLEKYLDWEGFGVEPSSTAADTWEKHRTSRVFRNCAWNENGHVEFQLVTGYAEMLSGVTSANGFNDTHKQRILDEIKKHGGTSELIRMPSRTVSSMLEEIGTSEVDYMSIDAEGAELEILRGFDFEKNSCRLISIEQNGYDDGSAANYLGSLGYRNLGRICNDIFFAFGA